MPQIDVLVIVTRTIVVLSIVILATIANRLGDITISGDALVTLYGTALGYTFGITAGTPRRTRIDSSDTNGMG